MGPNPNNETLQTNLNRRNEKTFTISISGLFFAGFCSGGKDHRDGHDS